eukprot:950710-Rhodomonas_salina.1
MIAGEQNDRGARAVQQGHEPGILPPYARAMPCPVLTEFARPTLYPVLTLRMAYARGTASPVLR